MLSMAAFFGGIALLDLRLVGWRRKLPLRPFADQVLPWLYATFGFAFATGLALFFYDPVHVGSHAYFTLKLILIALGVSNAGLFRRTGYLASLTDDTPMTAHPRIVGAFSLALWTGAIVCACLNVEAAPKMLLR